MNIKAQINNLGLDESNAVVIGSGILEALGIRDCGDIDVVVSEGTFEKLSKTGKFTPGENYGVRVLINDIFDIRMIWNVLGKPYKLDDLMEVSRVIDGVRYITLEFLLKTKESWVIHDEQVRPKDIRDISLMKEYLSQNK